MRETAYNTLVRPKLEYASPLWDPHTEDKISQIEKGQRRAARWTTSNYGYRSSVTSMIENLGWRTLEQSKSDARLCLFYRTVYGLLAVPIPDYIQPKTWTFKNCHSITFRQIHTHRDAISGVCLLQLLRLFCLLLKRRPARVRVCVCVLEIPDYYHLESV